MYVCVCHAISDRQIREAVARGAESLTKCRPIAGGQLLRPL
jgi:bacterioferritin-associated ferredoxin